MSCMASGPALSHSLEIALSFTWCGHLGNRQGRLPFKAVARVVCAQLG